MSANRHNLITQGGLTILFEEPFWIGLFEMLDESGLRVCKVTFGAEPTEEERELPCTDKSWGYSIRIFISTSFH